MATLVEPPDGLNAKGKHCYSVWYTLFEIDTKYVPIKPVGRGAYGVVCSSMNKETNEKVAIKKISNVFEHPVVALRTLREMKLLRKIRHENVIALEDVMMPVHRSSFKDLYLVYELMDTDLDRIINSPLPFSSDHCKFFLFQTLKHGNLLANANCDLKICDFGLSRTIKENGECMTEYVVTRWYRAPELLVDCESYGACIDMWSVGCIFTEILGRKPIFHCTDCLNQLELIINVLGSKKEEDLEFIDCTKSREYIKSLPFSRGGNFSQLYPHADPLALDLLRKMLAFNPNKRSLALEALQHPYMAGLYDSSYDRPAKLTIDLDIDERIGEGMMRHMMLKEMLYYHPQASSL